MVLAPSTFLLAIPFQPTTTIFTIIKLKQKNYMQEFDQQHGLRSYHFYFFCGARAMYFTLEMKALKDNCEHFEFSLPNHIYSNKSGKKQQ
jgi:uncharacterized membrane protein